MLGPRVLRLDLRTVAVLGDVDDERPRARGSAGCARVELRIVELERRHVTAGAADGRRSASRPAANASSRPGSRGGRIDRHLQLRQVADHGRQHARVDLEARRRPRRGRTTVPSRTAPRRACRRCTASWMRVGEQALMDVQRLLDHAAERGLMALPAERPHREVRVDAFDGAVVERAVGVGGDATERHALRGQRLLDAPAFGLRAPARAAAASACSCGAHLAARAVRPDPDRAGAADCADRRRRCARRRPAGTRSASACRRRRAHPWSDS